MRERLLSSLNPAQRTAVEHGPGPLLVLAGAGSGKTRVLTHRVAFMIEVHGVDPDRILAVTFTNKAAGEMRERIVQLLADRPGGIEGLWIGTFHSVCARILRRIADRFDYPRSFTIYDGDDSLQILKKVMDAMGWSIGSMDAYGVRRRISDAKNRLLSPEEYAATHSGHVEEAVAEAYRGYQRVLHENRALDFDDLLMRTVVAMREDERLLESLRRNFRHVLVDEYQDTNHAQYQFVKLLTAEHRSITVVGDDDQSIYGWRGADITNILSFEDDFPEAVAIRLEQNYRSTRVILEAAHAVVEKNRHRKPKKLWTEREGGSPLKVYGAADADSEAHWVARTISRLQAEGYAPSDVAVLYRTNAQSRLLEEGLRRRSLPYVIVGGTRFYERQEIKDAIAYLRVLVNPSDDWSMTRVLGVPKRGIGSVTMQTLEAVADERGVSLSAALVDPGVRLQVNAPTAAGLQEVADLLSRFAPRAAEEPAAAWIAEYLEEAGLFGHYRILKDPRREDRLENLHELVAGVQTFSLERGTGEGDLAAFLEEVSLLTDIDQADLRGGVVTLMTLHNAKGLEFPVVFLAGCEDGLFPLARALDSPREFEEERRLFYVGLTRARDRAILSYAYERYRWGQTSAGGPSPFLAELPAELVEWEEEPLSAWGSRGWRGRSRDAAGASGRDDVSRGMAGGAPAWDSIAVDDPPGGTVEPEEISDLAPDYRSGERVRHREFGGGRIVSVSGAGRDLKVTVRFDQAGEKRLVARFARLEKEW